MTVARIIATKGREVLTAQPHRTLKEVAEILSARNIGAVVVADVQATCSGSFPSATSLGPSADAAPRRSMTLPLCI